MKIGDKVFVVWDRGHGSRDGDYMTVTKLGRDWVYLGDRALQRFRRDDPKMVLDGKQFSSPGRCYPTREDFTAERALNHTWDWFRQNVYNEGLSCPPGVTRENIIAAAKLLGYTRATDP